MDSCEAAQMVFARVKDLEPQLVTKIMGHLLLRDNSDAEMFNLAFSTDEELKHAVSKVKDECRRGQHKQPHKPLQPQKAQKPQQPQPPPLQQQQQSTKQAQEKIAAAARKSSSPDAAKPSTCKYFSKGHCRLGVTCRFKHGKDCQAAAAPSASPEEGSALDKLEAEVEELLRARKSPISVAALPHLYYERYGKPLQADGYVTESLRPGKGGVSLSKVLSKFKGPVTLVDRPHGQHILTLAGNERFLQHPTLPDKDSDINSRQIYLTFPSDSAFSVEDVLSYFSSYGPVQDVRIPTQQKRMFGFVTFHHAETVKAILFENSPHFISGSRVLVKPYRDKPRDRLANDAAAAASQGMQPNPVCGRDVGNQVCCFTARDLLSGMTPARNSCAMLLPMDSSSLPHRYKLLQKRDLVSLFPSIPLPPLPDVLSGKTIW